MKKKNKGHLTLDLRQQIEDCIYLGKTQKEIAEYVGLSESTISREIKKRRQPVENTGSHLLLDCANYKKCAFQHKCKKDCVQFKLFKCTRRDRSPGACNGCSESPKCRHIKYKYSASLAQKDYENFLVGTREGFNITHEELEEIAKIIVPLIKNGQSVYAVLSNHPEIKLSEKTLYTYIENRLFAERGLLPIDLRRVVKRKITKKKQNLYKIRVNRKIFEGRDFKAYKEYINNNPNTSIVQMDTVYNDVTNGPFLQTFKSMLFGFIFAVYHEEKTSDAMVKGIRLLQNILGDDLYKKYVQLILTDRGTEFAQADAMEQNAKGEKVSMVFYCDPMCSRQKGSIENIHEEVRYIYPKNCDLRILGLTCQENLNEGLSNINSYPKEKLNGKSAIEVMEFFDSELRERFKKFGIKKIDKDKIILIPKK